MINNNKILTVSYGTFSCTLEGFDDSFGTMKAIAEYFRDLAADDRYFGAEPPQPDAQMLASIAQRQISRHVEARSDDGRIVLSAKEAPRAAALVAADVIDDVATAVADAAETKAELAPQDVMAPAAEPAAVQKAKPTLKKQQIRITHPKIDAAPVAENDQAMDEDEVDIVPSLPDSEVEAFFAERPATEVKKAAEPEQDVAARSAETVKADSIADKLKRIRAVVSQQAADDAAPDYSEDQHAMASAAKASVPAAASALEIDDEEDEEQNDVLASTLRDLEDALDADDALELEDESYEDEYDDEDEGDDDDISALLSRLESEAEAAEEDASDYDDDEDEDMGSNILAAMDGPDASDDADEDNLFDGDDTAEEVISAPVKTPPAPARPNTPARAETPAAPRTRVLKVKRATLEAAIQSGQLEEYDDEEEEEIQPVAARPLRKAPLAERSTLSDEEEDDLARELAALEADMAADDEADDDYDYDDDYEDDADEVEAPAPKAEIRGGADADFSRLMEETDYQMGEPESTTRRDAFAHLRAAVAAKKADEAVGGGDAEEDTGEAYRDDLANVVRPRRPASGERARTERPAEQRPAPLKLVAEQRIDVNATAPASPVRPRRVAAVTARPAATPNPAADDARSFADFASEMGAQKLPDLLEAAAAYLSFVEGHEQFSRPQLMTKVRQVEKENFTREDSLRSFGKLLQEGKIEKLRGGQFQASDQIGFKPKARAAG